MSMDTYRIAATIYRYVRMDIEADSQEQAEEMAYGMIDGEYDNDDIDIDAVVKI